MIYIDEHPNELDIKSALESVSPQRREYALRYRQERDRRLCLSAYLLLKRALSVEYGIDQVPNFVYDRYGKPILDGLPNIHFNISHCNDAVVCAVADTPVGIDIESLSRFDNVLSTQVMSVEEQRLIRASIHPDIVFTRLWTMKESLLKLTGKGLVEVKELIELLTNAGKRYRFHSWVGNGYVATLCQSSIME